MDFRLIFSYTEIPMPKVYMSFFLRIRWHIGFLESDLKTPLRRKLTFHDPAKLIEMVERGGGFKDQEQRLMLEAAIENGRGGTFITLTDEQYRLLL